MKMNNRTKEKTRKQRKEKIKKYFEDNISDTEVLYEVTKLQNGKKEERCWYEDVVSAKADESGYYYLTVNPVSEKGPLIKIAYQKGIQKHIMNPNAVKNRKKFKITFALA